MSAGPKDLDRQRIDKWLWNARMVDIGQLEKVNFVMKGGVVYVKP